MIKKKTRWKKVVAGVLTAVLLAGSMPDLQVYALEEATEEASEEDTYQEKTQASEESTNSETESETEQEENGTENSHMYENAVSDTASYQYVIFPNDTENMEIVIPEDAGLNVIEGRENGVLYRITTTEAEEFEFEVVVNYGYCLEIPENVSDIIKESQDRSLVEGSWVYYYGIPVSMLTTSEEAPLTLQFDVQKEMIPVSVSGEASIEGIEEDGTAQLGSEVSIEVTEPGYTLAMLTKDEKGNDVYTAMKLDYDNRYSFIVEEQLEFVVADPEQVDYTICESETRKAKITGEAGIKLKSLASSAQGYNEIVLNFTAVKNGSDGTETENVYYEVEVTAMANEGEELPAGSSTTPKYYYIPKVANTNTQSKSIIVNDGDWSAPTSCTYKFAVKMVLIDKNVHVPDANTWIEAPLEANLSGNTITKNFATKNLYYEDKLGFTKKTTKIYTGQENVLAGAVKYSKNASYIHDLTAVAYDSRGDVYWGITCEFKNDNDELYVSADKYAEPGKYKIVVYAGIGEEATADSPQSGTMYQANTSFTLTVEQGITSISTGSITKQVAVNSKDVTFSAVPVGNGYWKKPKVQKFTYEIKSAVPDDTGSGYIITDPVDKVKNNISVNKNGKVTVKRGYYVDSDTTKNHIAIVIKAADFAGNETSAVVYVEIVTTKLVPTEIYLTDSSGVRLSGTTISANKAHGAKIVVLDQNGNNMNEYVTITPKDNSKNTSKIYVSQYTSGDAYLYVRKPSTVTIKATTKDGGKQSKSLKLTITKPYVSQAAYYIYNVTSNGFNASDITTDNGYMTYSAPRGAVIKFKQGAKIDGKYYYNRYWFDWDYSIEGGKVKFDGEYWLITPTAKVVKLKVWIKSNPYRTWSLSLTNTNWDTKYESAPKVKLLEGKLYSNKYTNEDGLAIEIDEDGYEYGYVPSQMLTYQYEYGSYDEVRIAKISKSGPYLWVSDFDPENRTFKLNTSPGDNLKTGSFTYKLAFYREGTLMCKPATIKVKVNKSAKVKVTSSYKLDISKGDSVELKVDTKDFIPDFDTNLMNANVGGKANDFNKYFELEYIADSVTGETKPVIRFKSTVTPEEKESLKGKSLTGYVRYSYYYGYSYYNNNTAKVTIKIK